ncbi:MAG: type II toxin-antitoxin system HicB family antitoxin [Ignavibacteria bacterium]|nr:type II toxin-antitoxin system HicB family antitoxin [Ignavibacteriota bacterium]
MKSDIKITAVFEKAEEGGYVAYIEEIPGVNTQGETIEEAKENLYEALELVLEVNRELNHKETSNKETVQEIFSLVS